MKDRIFSAFTMRYYQIVLFFVSLLILSGAYSLWKMPKQEFPEFSMPIAIVAAVYPGASAEEVEQQVTNRLETYLSSFSEVNLEMLRSTSSDAMCSIQVTLNDKGAKNPSQVWGRIRDGLSLFKTTQLPPGVLGIAVLDNIGDAAAELICLDSDDKSPRELEDYLDDLKDRMRTVPGVCNLKEVGTMHEHIAIYLDKERMVKYGINRSMINAMLALQNITTGGAHADNTQVDVPIYVSKMGQTERDLADQIIYSGPDGKHIRLKDVARVVREYPEIDSYIANNGHRAVLLSMEMMSGGDIVAFGEEVNKRMEEFQKTLPPSININRIADQPKVVRDSIVSFLGDLLEAIIIVIIVMMILFPVRSAAVAGLSIPITIFIALFVMNVFGIPLNNVTLAALIVVLGMVVDDSIIIIDGHQNLLRERHSRWYCSVVSSHTYFPSVSLATISICLVFIPVVLLIPEMFKEFFSSFTNTLIISLMSSLAVAMILIPILNHKFLGRSKKVNAMSKAENDCNEEEGSRFLKPVMFGYNKLLSLCFRFPRITIASGILIAVLGGLLMKQIPIKMVPSADRDQFVIEVHSPNGSSIARTAAITDSVAAVMYRDPRVLNVTEFVGQLMPRFMVSAPIAMGSKSFSQMIIRTESSEATLDVIRDYTDYFSKEWPDTYVRMYQLSYAVAGGMAYVLCGSNIDSLHYAADQVKDFLNKQEGLIWVHDDMGNQIPSVSIDLDPIASAELGVTGLSVASGMAIRYGGMKVGSLWEDGYEMPVMVYTTDQKERHDLATIGDEYLGSMAGTVPLRQVATINPVWHEGKIIHKYMQRCINVEADVRPGYSLAKENQKLGKFMKEEMEAKLPEGVTWDVVGASYINRQLGGPLGTSLLVSLIIIFFIMLLNYKRFGLSALALCGTLLALPGAALGLYVSGFDLSMTAMLGIISLLGIVMRNSVIMFDYAEELRHGGMSVKEAAINAGKRRMIPIFLTSATTAVGVLPLMLSNSTLWPSMGWVICFGTLAAMVLVVTVMPVAYWRLIDKSTTKETSNRAAKGAVLVGMFFVLLPLSANAQTVFTLQEAVNQAIKNNVEVQQKRLSEESIAEVKKELFTHYFPSVSASATYFERSRGLAQGSGFLEMVFNALALSAGMDEETLDFSNTRVLKRGVLASINVVQPLFLGGRLVNANKLAGIGMEASSEYTALKEQEIRKEVEKYFWQLVQVYEGLRSVDIIDTLVISARHDAELALRAGLVTKNDQMQVDIQGYKAESLRLKLGNAKDLCRDYLAYLLNVEKVDSIVWDDIYALQEPYTFLTDAETAVRNRHEMSLLNLNLQASKLKKRITLGNMLPTAVAMLSFGTHKFDAENDRGLFDDCIDTRRRSWFAAANVSVPISGWWGGSHTLRRSSISVKMAEFDLDDKRNLMTMEIDRNWKTLNEKYKQVDVARKQYEQATQNLKQQESAYRSGMITMTDRLLAQSLYEQSNTGYIEACVQYRLAILEYLQSTGR